MTALVVALGAVVALLTVLVVGLLRSHAEVLRALHQLGVRVVRTPPTPSADRPWQTCRTAAPTPRPRSGIEP